VHAETRTKADIAITTAEGDTVMLSASTVFQAAYASYDVRGRLATQGLDIHADAAQAAASQGTAITIAGDLNDEELADVHHLLEDLSALVADFLAADVDDAVTHTLDIGALDTLANFDALFEYVQDVRVEQQYTAQRTVHYALATEKPVAVTRIGPSSIERFLDRMRQVIEESQVDPETLAAELPKCTDRLIHKLSHQYGADTAKTQLAGHVLTKFANHLNNLVESSKGI
jgi:hypothetical protein